jgi:hypothetical protein
MLIRFTGNPTITSTPIRAWGITSLILFTRSVYTSLRYLRFINFKYRYYLIATEYENVAQSSTLETNSIVSFFQQIGFDRRNT